MRLKIGFFLITLLFACLEKIRASQDVDGTIVWVDNDKKEKDITIGAPNTFENAEMKYWKFADDKIDGADPIQSKKHDSTTPTMYIGNEDTPSAIKKPQTKEVEPANTVDAQYITASESEEHVEADDNRDNEMENQPQVEVAPTQYDGQISHLEGASLKNLDSTTLQPHESDGGDGQMSHLEDTAVKNLDSTTLQPHESDGHYEMESDEDDEGRNIVSSEREQLEAADSILESLTDDHSQREMVTETGATKATIQKHENNNKKTASDVNVKKDHGVGETGDDSYGEVLTRMGMGPYTPDDNDISDIVSRFTDNKSDYRHHMGKDELQMHLDDEALKMEVKAIEEEDSNVKNVLQGAEKFANGQKLGRFEGEFEKDLIKDIGKTKVEVEGDSYRNKGRDDEATESDKSEDRQEINQENENKEENEEQEEENSEQRGNDEQPHEEKLDDENGERKHIITIHDGKKHHTPTKPKRKKYRLFGVSTKHGEVVTDNADMKVEYDNEAMESEVKAIEDADEKVSSALEGDKNSMTQNIEEYKYDSPQFYTLDGQSIHKHHHGTRKENLPGKPLEEKLTDKTGASEKTASEVLSSSDSKVTDEITTMLRETSEILNQTNAILNESFFAVNKTNVNLNPAKKEVDSSGGISNLTNSAQNVTTRETNTTTTSHATDGNPTANLSMSNNKTNENDYHSHSNSSSADGKEKKISNENAAKRGFEKEDHSDTNKSSRARKKSHHHHHKKHRAVSIEPTKKYNKKELRILKLMYPGSAPPTKKSHKLHKKKFEKRSVSPISKSSYRRFKKQKGQHHESLRIDPSEKRGFRRLGLKKKPNSEEVGRRRGDVQEGMTGAISYTNRDGNEFMFAVSRETLTWAEAGSKCRSLGGELVSIGDKEEQEFIQANVIPEKGHYWIGFSDQENEGIWQWTDKTPVRYTNWANLEPDDGNIKNGQATHNEDCAVITPTMEWSDLPCWNRFQFICKISPDNGRAISFGGTLSHGDVGNKQSDSFAEGLKVKNRPTIPVKKPVKEGNPSTRQKANEMKKGYSGQGPSRGGYKAEETDEPPKIEGNAKANVGMMKGKQAGVSGGAGASASGGANALSQASKNAAAGKQPVKSPAPAAMKQGKYANAGGNGAPGPGVTGLGSVPGVTAASLNGNGGLGKIGGMANGAQAPVVNQGGNGGQSATNLANQGGAANQQTGNAGGANMAAQGGGGNRPASPGANGGAPGHVATNGWLAQAPSGGVPGGGAGRVGNNAGPAGGGRLPPAGNPGGGQMPANNGGGVPPANNGGGVAPPNNGGGVAPANNGGVVPSANNVGGVAPPNNGGGVAPANNGVAPVNAGNNGGGGMPAAGVQAPQGPVGPVQRPTVGAPVPAAPNNNGGGQGGPSGGAPELSPIQAKVAQQLANMMAPQLERQYAEKFEPEMQMMKTICGKLCSDVALALPNDDPEKTGKACGGICARSLLKKSPDEAMDLLIGLAKGAEARPTRPAVAAQTGTVPVAVAVPVKNPGVGGGQAQGGGPGNTGGNVSPNNGGVGNGGGGNGGGGNVGGSNVGGGNYGGGNGGGGNGGGGNGGGSMDSGGGGENAGGGNGNNVKFRNGNSINLEELGAKIAPKLGLSVQGDGKITASDGESLKEKVTDAISSLKNEDESETASKSALPGRTSHHKKTVHGFYMLKRTNNAVAAPTKKHKVKHAKKHIKKPKKHLIGLKRRTVKNEKGERKETLRKRKLFIITL